MDTVNGSQPLAAAVEPTVAQNGPVQASRSSSVSEALPSEVLIESESLESFKNDHRLPVNISPYFEIRPSPKGGYGAFALQDMEPFNEVLSEMVLMKATNAEIITKFSQLSPDDAEIFMFLASYDKTHPNKIISIFKTNRFQMSQGECGIFPIASRFNHACQPLCHYWYDYHKKRLVLMTIASIVKGQELTISYGYGCDELWELWGFLCDCGKCVPSAKTIESFERRRRQDELSRAVTRQ